MSYFLKSSSDKWFTILPPSVLPVISNDLLHLDTPESAKTIWCDDQENRFTRDLSLSLYHGCWKVSNHVIEDMIENQVDWELDELKVVDFLVSDLGLDSLDLVEMAFFLEQRVDIPISEGLHFVRAVDLVDYIFLIMVGRLQRKIIGWPKSSPDRVLD